MITSSEQEKHLLIEIQLFQSKAVFVLNVSAKFEDDQTKDEEAAPILTWTVFSNFRYSTEQRGRHRRHSDVIMDLTFTAFESFLFSKKCQAKFGCNWTTNKGECAPPPPHQPV